MSEAVRRERAFSLQGLMTPDIAAWIGLAFLAIPTIITVARRSWTSEEGQYGPLVLGLGALLLYRDRARAWGRARLGDPALSILFILLGAELYLVARLADQYIAEAFALAWIGLAVVYALFGSAWMRALWFPLAFLLLAIPAPFSLTFPIATGLRALICILTVKILQLCNLDVVRDGLNIDIDQYTIAIAEACSGMNSLISLSAIGLLYLYVRREAGPLQMLAMAPVIILFALLGNLLRVITLVVSTHLYGDLFTQSAVHEAAGILSFILALLGVIGVDEAMHRRDRLWRLVVRRKRRR